MAAAETEPAKLLLPYLQRADELQKHEPLVAYYCRLYAMERGLKIPQSGRTKTTNSILVSLMNQLEKDKKSLKLSPDDHLHLEGFALNVFAKADKEDRAGRADLNTAKTFYAASIFFEILNQFGELAPDLEQKQKYAVWKAADIRKALKEGRKPVPGPPGGEKDQATPSGTADGVSDLEPSHIDRSPQVDPSPPVDPSSQMDTSPFPRPQEEIEPQPYIPPPPSSYPSHYSANDYSSPPPTNGADNSAYAQPFPHQSYPQEPQHHIPQRYPSQDVPSPFTYPNFQSYRSFSESSLPTATTHYPSYPQGPDASYPHLPNSLAPNYPSPPQPPQHSSIDGNGTIPGAVSAPPAQAYQYDSNYQPPPEKITEAHKAARFAVGALAFDDVFVAVDYLKKSLDLLTNPSAKH